jgi:hypothetical protein
MATYVLVHGGAHGGWCYGPVARILRSAGQEVHAPTLTGLGDRSHLEAARAAGRLWDIDTGHDLMITEPEVVAALLLKAATA